MIDELDIADGSLSRCSCSHNRWCSNAVKLILMGQKASRRADYGAVKLMAHIFYAHRMTELKKFAMAAECEKVSQCFERMDSVLNPISQTLVGVERHKWADGSPHWKPKWGAPTLPRHGPVRDDYYSRVIT